jgi:hypothetical protein
LVSLPWVCVIDSLILFLPADLASRPITRQRSCIGHPSFSGPRVRSRLHVLCSRSIYLRYPKNPRLGRLCEGNGYGRSAHLPRGSDFDQATVPASEMHQLCTQSSCANYRGRCSFCRWSRAGDAR